MQDPTIKTRLYWCPDCNVPLLGKSCACGRDGETLRCHPPFEVRPALRHDREVIAGLLRERFGVEQVPRILLLCKSGGLDRVDRVIAAGREIGQLRFDPVSRTCRFDPSLDALFLILPSVSRGIVDIPSTGGHVVGKRVPVETDLRPGPVIVRQGGRWGVGQLRGGAVRVKELGHITPRDLPDPSYEDAVARNHRHLKNMERHAVRTVRRYMRDGTRINVAISGGKDSTAVREIARRAGVEETYFVDTGMEFPETLTYIDEIGVDTILSGGDFWRLFKQRDAPAKDDRWCCEELKIAPIREWIRNTGGCRTVQGIRWYESFSRSRIPESMNNPLVPGQETVHPIRNWRALEVFFYIWWRGVPCNPLYEMGLERVGCWMCPAMLEAEFEIVKEIHPHQARQWMDRLVARGSMPEAYYRAGLWRWRRHPPKAQECARSLGLHLPNGR